MKKKSLALTNMSKGTAQKITRLRLVKLFAINTDKNSYTIIFAIIMVVVFVSVLQLRKKVFQIF